MQLNLHPHGQAVTQYPIGELRRIEFTVHR
jgi:hypothetical protein